MTERLKKMIDYAAMFLLDYFEYSKLSKINFSENGV